MVHVGEPYFLGLVVQMISFAVFFFKKAAYQDMSNVFGKVQKMPNNRYHKSML